MKVRRYIYKDIEEFLQLRNTKHPSEIAKQLGRTTSAIDLLAYYYREYKAERYVSKNLGQLFKQYEKNHEVDHAEKQESQESQDAVSRIEQAKKELDNAIVAFIDEQVEKQTKQKLAEKEKDMEQIKNRYEQELKKMQELLVAAKESNIIGTLRKRFDY